MKKILFVANSDNHINLCYLPYIKYLSKNYIVDVATNTDLKISNARNKYNIGISRKPFRLCNIKAIFKLKDILEKEKYDLILTSTPMGSVVARISKCLSKDKFVKLIYTVHGFHFFKGNFNLIYFLVEKILMRYVDILITINYEDYINALKYFKVDTRFIDGIGYNSNLFNTNLNDSQKINLKKSLGINGKFVITYVAEISKRKRQKYLINTLSKMNLNNTIVLLVGSDNTNGKIEKLIKKRKLENHIKLTGFRKDISKILDITDLVISVSKQEGLPLNIMEAMHKRKVIMVTDCRGNRDLIKNNINGIVVPINNKKILIEKINYVINNYSVVSNLASNNDFVHNYSIDNILNKYIDIFIEILRGSNL